MTSVPKLSIITVNLNNFVGLEKTMQSVFSQTYTDYEYIIIDGGSTDGSKEFIKNHAERLVYWVSEKDGGIYPAMNKGIMKANGEYLLFLNSGDWLVGDDVCKSMMYNSFEDLVYGNLERTFPDGKTDIVKMPENLTVDFMINMVLCHPVTFFKKKLFDDYGFYDERFKIISDWVFFLKIVITKNVTWKYRDRNITMFVMDGISSKEANQSLILKEKQQAIDEILPLSIKYLLKDFQLLKDKNEQLKIVIKSKRYLIKEFLPHGIIIFYRKIKLIKGLKILLQFLRPKTIPIIINSYNRLSCLKVLIERLERLGYKRIIILDNKSTYAPLLDYLAKTKYEVIKLDKNFGHLAIWASGVYRRFENIFFFYTDPDVIPDESCPRDFAQYFINLMMTHSQFKKVGFALRIDNIPDKYEFKEKVLRWESQFWKEMITENVYAANIDTTFALYAPNWFREKFEEKFYEALRVNGKYSAQHLSWYIENVDKTDEDLFYFKTAMDVASWTKTANSGYYK